jgi:hypothetical protein
VEDKNSNSALSMNIGSGMSMIIGLPKLSSWNTRGRPKKAKGGTIGFNWQTESLEYFNGTYWLSSKMQKI